MAIKILLVDDHPVNLRMLSFALRKVGHDVVPVSDGETAMAELQRARPDMILLDLQMPRMSGYQLAQWIRQQPTLQTLPIVAVTAYAMRGDEEKALAAGCNAYVTKPVDLMALRALVVKMAAEVSADWSVDCE